MPRTKRIFISDVHLEMKVGALPPGKHDYTWLKEDAAKDFASFLQYLNAAPDVEEVVLLGDIFDNWCCPVELQPPTFSELLESQSDSAVVAQLKALAANQDVRVMYLPGNHDMGMTREVLADAFPGLTFGGSTPGLGQYRSSRLLAEHGSAYGMFNAPDPYNSPKSGLPLGHFITRVVTTRTYNTGTAMQPVTTAIHGLADLFGPDELGGAVLDGVLDDANLPLSTPIMMPMSYGPGAATTAQAVKDKYNDIYGQWTKYRGPAAAFNGVLAEIKRLGLTAENVCANGDVNVVIFGHSHDPRLDRLSTFLGRDFIYANCGAWCESDKPRTYIEVERDRDNREQTVRLIEWKNGQIVKDTIQEETISL
jgi:UDP-2,3-diacylglucosamine pyrophosphatase LpxH